MSFPNVRPGDPVPSPLSLSFEGADDADGTAGDPMRAIVSGEIDVATAPVMQTQIAEARRRRGTNRVVLDLEGVNFMDSSGLRVILLLHQQLESEHGGLVLTGAAGDVRNVLELTGLDRHLNIAETLKQAQAILAGELQAADEGPGGPA